MRRRLRRPVVLLVMLTAIVLAIWSCVSWINSRAPAKEVIPPGARYAVTAQGHRYYVDQVMENNSGLTLLGPWVKSGKTWQQLSKPILLVLRVGDNVTIARIK